MQYVSQFQVGLILRIKAVNSDYMLDVWKVNMREQDHEKIEKNSG